MNFSDALLTVDLVIKSKGVPLLIGESGIGKTALVRELAYRNGYYSINIDGNMLKEGEIGGLPAVEEYRSNLNGKEVIKKKTVYAVHTKLLEIDEVIMREPTRDILLFIDEINRCEHSVQQELMNIILNREINGYILPNNVKVIAAMNPSNKYDNFSDSDYGVVDMDPAQENRFVWIELEADIKSWIKWGMDKKRDSDESNIEEQVLEFIASFPQYLHTPHSREAIKATPRSWERVSDSYRVYLKNKDKFPTRIFYNVVKGNIGANIAQDFYNYIENSKKPLIKPEEIFTGKIEETLKKRVEKESHSRLYLAGRKALIYLNNTEHESKDIRAFSEFIQLYPSDLKMSIMQDIKLNYEEGIYQQFLQDEVFVEGYFSMYEQLHG